MKFLNRNCREVTALVLAREDRKLGLFERCGTFGQKALEGFSAE